MLNWNSLILFLAIILCGELVAALLFWLIVKVFKRDGVTINSILRGFLERLFVYFSLVNGVMHALTLFGALKIATHIKDDDKISNDYFLIGNLVSAFLAISYFLVYQEFMGTQNVFY